MNSIILTILNPLLVKLQEIQNSFNSALFSLYTTFKSVSIVIISIVIIFQIIVIGFKAVTNQYGSNEVLAYIFKLTVIMLFTYNLGWISSNFLVTLTDTVTKIKGSTAESQSIRENMELLKTNPLTFTEKTSHLFFKNIENLYDTKKVSQVQCDNYNFKGIDNCDPGEQIEVPKKNFGNMVIFILGLIISLFVILVCVFFSISLFIAQLEFNLVVLLAMVVYPLSTLDYLRDYGQVAIKAIITCALRIAFFYLLAAVSLFAIEHIFGTLQVKNINFFDKLSNMLVIFISAILLLFLYIQGQNVINTIITGTPSLSGAQVMRTIATAGAIVGGGIVAGKMVGSAAQKTTGSALKTVSSGIGAGKISAAAGNSRSTITKDIASAVSSNAINRLGKTISGANKTNPMGNTIGKNYEYGKRHAELQQQRRK